MFGVYKQVDGQNFVSTIILNPLLAKHQGTLTCTAVGSNNDTDHRDFPIVVKGKDVYNPPVHVHCTNVHVK